MAPTELSILFCLLLDIPKNSHIDCEIFANGTLNEGNCFRCDITGKFAISGGRTGHVMCILLWIVVLILGAVGTIANCLIILVLKRRARPTSFDTSLFVLAAFDLCNSLFCLSFSTGLIFILENWDHGLFTLACFCLSAHLTNLGRSGSSYMTVFIMIDRYLAIASPVNSRLWFTPRRTRLAIIGIILLALMFNIPRLTSMRIGYNDLGRNVPSLADKEYIIFPKGLEPLLYTRFFLIHVLDCFGPFFLLIILNGLLFVKISKFSKMRQRLSNAQKSDINAAKMFIPVVVVLFACYMVPAALHISVHFYHVIHRELWFGMLLSLALNSAVNLPIYYHHSSQFREEFNNILPDWLKVRLNNDR